MTGNMIRQRRKEAGLSLRQLSERVGVWHTTIAKWEKDERGIKLDDLQRIAAVLKCDISDLLPYSGHKEVALPEMVRESSSVDNPHGEEAVTAQLILQATQDIRRVQATDAERLSHIASMIADAFDRQQRLAEEQNRLLAKIAEATAVAPSRRRMT